MKIHETRQKTDAMGRKVTQVMVESVVNDVAVYERFGHVGGEDAAAHGRKLSEHSALREGFRVPTGKHYRH